MDDNKQAIWRAALYDPYSWIAEDTYWFTQSPLEVVDRILDESDEDIENVYQSSIWAVAMAYRDYKNNSHFLTVQDHKYTRSRGGVLGTAFVGDDIITVTLREFLEDRDPGFSAMDSEPSLRSRMTSSCTQP